MHDIGELHNDFALNRKFNIRFLALICLMNVVKTEHEEEFVIELANEVRNTAKLAKGSEGIVETCGFSCTHPSKLSLKLNFHISYPINN